MRGELLLHRAGNQGLLRVFSTPQAGKLLKDHGENARDSGVGEKETGRRGKALIFSSAAVIMIGLFMEMYPSG